MTTTRNDVIRRLDLYEPYFDSKWYLECYPDVTEFPDGPLMHFLLFGEKELRDPNPLFNTFWFAKQHLQDLPKNVFLFEYFIRYFASNPLNPNPFTSTKYILENYDIEIKIDNIFTVLLDKKIDYTCKWFSKITYSSEKSLQSGSPELFRLAWQDLIKGKLTLPENFQLIDNLTDDLVGKGLILETVITDSKPKYVRQLSPGDEISFQLAKLAEIDGNLSVQGKNPVSSIRVFDAVDLKTRDNISLKEIESFLVKKYNEIFLISNLDRGGASTYLMEFVSCMNKVSNGRTLIILTDMWKVDLHNNLMFFSKYRTDQIEFLCLRDFVHNSGRNHQVLMQVIMLLSPNRLWIMNSKTGYEIISKYGRNLKNLGIRSFCFFFSEAQHYISHSRDWLGKVLPFSTIISDNENFYNSVKKRVGDFLDYFWVIRRPIAIDNRQIINVSRNIMNRKNSNAPLKVLWFGRWESKKDIWLLLEICGKFPEVIFEQYGTLEEEIQTLLPLNLKLNGGVRNFDDVPVDQFDVMFFSSEFEGMPNTVLEAVAVGLPVVAAKVGGLSEVFAENSIFYFENSSNAFDRLQYAQTALTRFFTADIEIINSHRLNALKDLETCHTRLVIENKLIELIGNFEND